MLTHADVWVAVIFGNTLYIVTPCLRRRIKELDAAPRLLREARIPFDIRYLNSTLIETLRCLNSTLIETLRS
jgi:hypothetical protein